jgi:hypothetical protein
MFKVNDLEKFNFSKTELFDDAEIFLTEFNDEVEQIAIIGGS